MKLTSVDLRYAVQELQPFVGGKIEKITQSDKEKRDVLLTLYAKDQSKTHLRFLLPDLLCSYAEKPVYQQVPPGFAMFLRKYIQNARITSIAQVGFDRVLEVQLDTKHGVMRLITEFLSPGNMLLLNEDGTIRGLLETQNYKDRTLRGGIVYKPPEPSLNLPGMYASDIVQAIRASDRDSIVTSLAMVLGLGGVYAEEVCERAQVEKTRNDLTNEEIERVANEALHLFTMDGKPHKDDKRVYPIAMTGRSPVEGTFLANLSAYVPVKEEKEQKDTKLANMRKAQEKNIEKQEEIAITSRKAGERIYEEYQVVQQILTAADQARKEKKDVGEALKRFPHVTSYNKKTQEIEVEL